MIVRNLTRRPLRSVLAAAGMAFAIAIVVLGAALSGGVDRTIDVAFHRECREDISLQLAHPRALGTVRDFLALPGVVRAEPIRVVPTRIVTVGRGQDVIMVGLPDGGTLRHIVDSRYREFPPLREGIAVTRWLANRMGLRRGALATIEIREHQRRIVTARVIEIVDEPLLNAIYLELGALGRLLGEPETYSGMNLRIDPVRKGELYASLKRLPVAASVDLRPAAIENFKKTSDTIVRVMRQIEIVFAIIIAFGVVYNTARIALAERGRELATLRVLGFTRGEVSRILLGEVAALAVPAIPLGSIRSIRRRRSRGSGRSHRGRSTRGRAPMHSLRPPSRAPRSRAMAGDRAGSERRAGARRERSHPRRQAPRVGRDRGGRSRAPAAPDRAPPARARGSACGYWRGTRPAVPGARRARYRPAARANTRGGRERAGRRPRVARDSRECRAGRDRRTAGRGRRRDAARDLHRSLLSDAAQVRVGASARVTGWGGQPLTARVRKIEPAAFTKVSALGLEEQRVHVVLDLAAPPPPELGHDYRGDVAITVWQGKDVVRVPATALFRDGDRWAVFVVRDGRARATPVEIGASDGTSTAVTRGLDAG